MRRHDREVTDPTRIREIIRSCSCLHLGLKAGEYPYIVPVSFGYRETEEKRFFYFHSAAEGRKLELIEADPRAAFELECGAAVRSGQLACEATTSFSCVMGTGLLRRLSEEAEKKAALLAVMSQNTGREDWEFDPALLNRVAVFELEVRELSCKVHE